MSKVCARCGLPKELCVCDDISRDQQKIKVKRDKRTYGKVVTVIEGLEELNRNKIAKDLKKKFACGGTTKNSQIVLQGDHLNRMKDALVKMGFPEEAIDILG